MKIAMDGPAGAGKSTVAKLVAEKLNIHYLDTGAMYRAMAVALTQKGVDTNDVAAVKAACESVEIGVLYKDGKQLMTVGGEDITALLRGNEASKAASAVAVVPEVRYKLVELQRAVASEYDVVMDGRDIGSYVLPDADYKFYITASSRVRAKRRYSELENKAQYTLDEIERDITARDKNDMNREFAPLRQCEDAVLVDTTSMSIEEVVSFVLDVVK